MRDFIKELTNHKHCRCRLWLAKRQIQPSGVLVDNHEQCLKMSRYPYNSPHKLYKRSIEQPCFWVVHCLVLLLGCTNMLPGQTLELQSQLDYVTSRGTDVWEYIDEQGKIYAVAGEYSGFVLIDVTEVTDPILVARVEGQGFDVKVWRSKVYAVSSGGSDGKIFDVKNPLKPVYAGAFEGGHNIFIDDQGRLFNTSQNVYKLDSITGLPTLLGSFGSGETTHDLTVRRDRIISCDGSSGTSVYDYSNPEDPLLLMQFSQGTFGYHHQGDFSEDDRFLFVTDELSSGNLPDIFIWNISDTDNPELVYQITDPRAIPHNLFILKDIMYVSYYAAGIKIYDVSEATSPILLDVYDTNAATGDEFTGAFGIYPSPISGNIYVTDSDHGLFVFRLKGELTDDEQIQSDEEMQIEYLYPQNTIVVKQLGSIDERDLFIFNVGGQLVKSTRISAQKISHVLVSDIPMGVYFIAIETEQRQLVTKQMIKTG